MLVLMIGGCEKRNQNAVLDPRRWCRRHHKPPKASMPRLRQANHQWICVMGKKRWQVSEQTIFDENPFLDGFFEWMDSPEGERATEVLDTLLDLMADVHVDPKQRRLVWPDAGQLTLQQSIEHIQKQCPDFSVEEIEGHLLYWIESGYGPDNCSEQQLEQLEKLSLQWVADHTQRAA